MAEYYSITWEATMKQQNRQQTPRRTSFSFRHDWGSSDGSAIVLVVLILQVFAFLVVVAAPDRVTSAMLEVAGRIIKLLLVTMFS